MDLDALLGHAVTVTVTQAPQIGNARRPYIVTDRQHAGVQPIERFVELGQHRRVVGLAVAIGVAQHADLIFVASEPVHAALVTRRPFLEHRQALVSRLHLKIIIEQEAAGAVLLGAAIEAVLLGHQHTTARIDIDRHRIAEQRMLGVQRRGEASRQAQRLGYAIVVGDHFVLFDGNQRQRAGQQQRQLQQGLKTDVALRQWNHRVVRLLVS